jgi:hypothetical protein
VGDVQDVQAIRAAKNEDLFREVNERIKEITPSGGIEALCECTDVGCQIGVILSRAEYEAVRSDGAHFVVAPGHNAEPIERVVRRAERYWVVEKMGKAAEEAERLNPRQ